MLFLHHNEVATHLHQKCVWTPWCPTKKDGWRVGASLLIPVSPTKIPFGGTRGWAGSCVDNHKKMNVGISMLARALWFSSCEKKIQRKFRHFYQRIWYFQGCKSEPRSLKAEMKNTMGRRKTWASLRACEEGRVRRQACSQTHLCMRDMVTPSRPFCSFCWGS